MQPAPMEDRKVCDLEWMGIDWHDAPDFCDAYICSAVWDDTGEELTDDELDILNDSYERYDLLMEHLY